MTRSPKAAEGSRPPPVPAPSAAWVPMSPLAFEDRSLETQFLRKQLRIFRGAACWWSCFQILATLIIVLRMWSSDLVNCRLLLLCSLSLLAYVAVRLLLLRFDTVTFNGWPLLTLGMYLHHHVWGAALRGAFPEVVGKDPLSIMTFYKDYVHAGGCILTIVVPGVMLPLPYWYHMGFVMGMASLWTLHNGWHCRANLLPDHLPATTAFLSKAFVQPLTRATSFMLSGRSEAFPLNETVQGSCEAATAATQWVCTLAVIMYSVWNELMMRLRFLTEVEERTSPRSCKLFGDWPGGPPKAMVQCLTAVFIPVQCFNVLWHVWLILLHRVMLVWEEGLPTGSSFLHMPYWVQ